LSADGLNIQEESLIKETFQVKRGDPSALPQD